MSDQQYLDFLKGLENELLSFRWGCVFDLQKKISLAEFGNVPTSNGVSVSDRCNAVFEEVLQSQKSSVEFMALDDQWILLMRQFPHRPLRCFILLRSGGVTTGWARDTLKQKIEEYSFS